MTHMWSFLAENGGTLLVGVLVLAVVVLVVLKILGNRRKGKSSCGCGCDHCPSSGMCHSRDK